ncbi:response regulator [Murimonas intestini]|uniref:response regulator n=1 Tax=Murimonas intestini TaxID=1337051 RepID=UPI0011DCFFAF|nr:response regulator [Murimonas intestini]
MYKVLLVDDEALIREAISENTKWNELGYELVGACKNGKEAIEKIKENPPDLLLTDICMPYVDGMDLTKFVYENYRDTKVVIISGYDEFEYAKNAVKYQVVEYILKPITALELSETLKKVREKLDGERLQNQNMKKIKGAYISNLPLLRGRFLNSLLAGNIQIDNIKEKLVDYDIHLSGKCFMTALVLGDDFTSFLSQEKDIKPDLGYFAIYNISEEILSHYEQGVTFQDIEERTILVFSGDAGLEKRALQICEEIQKAIMKFLKIECTIAVGQAVDSLEKLYESFADTKKALEYKFLLGGNQIIYAADLRGSSARQGVDVARYAGQVALEIKTGNEEGIRRQIQEFIQAVRDAYVSRNRSIFYVQNAILSIMNSLDTTSINESMIFTEERELLNTIYNKEQLSDIAEDLVLFCVDIARNMKDQKDSYCKKQAILALDYIDKNYGDADVSLNTVCSYLAMSTSYFSSIFKAYTGETFIEALTKKRIERAKLLLENTAKKAYEIADEVGYSDPHYFSSTFKKMTGMTPTEYAKRVR